MSLSLKDIIMNTMEEEGKMIPDVRTEMKEEMVNKNTRKYMGKPK